MPLPGAEVKETDHAGVTATTRPRVMRFLRPRLRAWCPSCSNCLHEREDLQTSLSSGFTLLTAAAAFASRPWSQMIEEKCFKPQTTKGAFFPYLED